MRRLWMPCGVLAAALALSVLGCRGEDAPDRGLTPTIEQEEAVPTQPEEMQESEQQREEELTEAMREEMERELDETVPETDAY